MAAIARLNRRPSIEHDAVEQEAIARAKLNAERKQQEAEKKAGMKNHVELEAPSIAAFSQGVHTAFDDYHDVETTSPIAPRATEAAKKEQTKPVATKSTPAKTVSAPIIGSGWAPVGLQAANKALVEPAAPYPVGTPIEQAVAVLGEALREERRRTQAAEERAERLADELEKVRQQLMEQTMTFAKTIMSGAK